MRFQFTDQGTETQRGGSDLSRGHMSEAQNQFFQLLSLVSQNSQERMAMRDLRNGYWASAAKDSTQVFETVYSSAYF